MATPSASWNAPSTRWIWALRNTYFILLYIRRWLLPWLNVALQQFVYVQMKWGLGMLRDRYYGWVVHYCLPKAGRIVERKKQILWYIRYKTSFIILTVAFSTIGLKTPSSWGVAETRWTFGKRSLRIYCVPNIVEFEGACCRAFYKIIALFGWKTLYLAITGSK